MAPAAGGVTAAAYERVSTRVQGQSGFSLSAQGKDVAQYAADQGWSLPEELRFRDGEDRHASGADWDLPGLNAMLDAAKRRDFSVLIVPAVDRFARDMTKALVLEQQLRKFGVRVVYLSAPVEDTAEGRLLLRQLQSFAEYEREKITFRTMRGRREKIDRGLVLGSGPAPYGYRYIREGERNRVVGLEPDPATAPIVQRIFKESLGRSAIAIADRLTRDGVPRPSPFRGKTYGWTQSGVQRILTNPTYCGSVVYGAGFGRTRAKHFLQGATPFNSVVVPALIPGDLWQDVQRMTTRRHLARGARKSGPDPFLLRGMLSCGHCGGGLSAKWNTFGQRIQYRQYHCIRSRPFVSRRAGKDLCPMRDVRADELELAVWQLVTCALTDPIRFRQGITAARRQRTQAESERKQRLRSTARDVRRTQLQIERIVDELLETPKGTQSYRALVERQREAEVRLARLTREQADLSNPADAGLSEAAAGELERFAREVLAGIEHASLDDRRELLNRLRLQGKLMLDREGTRLGRRHRFRIELEAVFDLNVKQAIGSGDSSTPRSDALLIQAGEGSRLLISVRSGAVQ